MHISATQHITAPVETVFDVFTDLEHCAGRIQAIKKVEILTPGKVGVGTRWRETRIMVGKEVAEVLEITALEPNKSYSVGCESCGCVYRTTFHFQPEGDGTRVDMEFETEAKTFFAKLMSPMTFLMKGMLKKCLAGDLNDLKKFCEATPTR